MMSILSDDEILERCHNINMISPYYPNQVSQVNDKKVISSVLGE